MVAILARYAARFSVRALDLTVDSSMLWVGASLAVAAAVLLAFVPRLPSADTSHGIGLSKGSVRITGSTSRRLVLPVIRTLPLERPDIFPLPADGRRGTNAKNTAATTASAAPIQSRLESTVRSSARTENREAYRARMATIGRALSTPSVAPAPQSRRLSASSVRRSAPVLAPSAERIASSPSRRTVRASIRLATLEHAITKTSADAASRTSNTVLARDVIWSRSRTASIRKSARAEYASGCSFRMAP